MRFGIPHHLVNLLFRQTRRRGDRDLLFPSGAHVFCRNIHDTVGVDVKCDLDLWHAARRWWNTDEMKLTEGTIVSSHWSLALEHMYLYGGLIIRGGRKD